MLQPASFKHVVAFLGTCEIAYLKMRARRPHCFNWSNDGKHVNSVGVEGRGNAREQDTVEIERSQ